MSQMKVTKLVADPPQAGELCERCGVKALVSALVVLRTTEVVRFTFCGHHFDDQHKSRPFAAYYDTRTFQRF